VSVRYHTVPVAALSHGSNAVKFTVASGAVVTGINAVLDVVEQAPFATTTEIVELLEGEIRYVDVV
jgi:hypothetical protein